MTPSRARLIFGEPIDLSDIDPERAGDRMTQAEVSERFKQALNEFGLYRLFPAHVANQQIQDMDVSLYIEKREIHFVQIADIHPNDPEYAIFAKNDTNSFQFIKTE